MITSVFAILCAAVAVHSDEIKPMEIGDAALPFELPGVDGETYTLDRFADAEVLVMIFTCNHCPTSQAYEERIKQMVRDYEERGVAIVAISPNDEHAVRLDELGYTDVNDSFEDMALRAEWMEFNFPYLYAGDQEEWCKSYGPVATPHVFIFDAERKLRFKGRIDNNEREHLVETHDTRNAIEALLAGEPVPVETTPVFGCSVKYSDKRESVQASLARWAQEEVSLEPITVRQVRELVANDSGKLRLINVWATFCGPCVEEFPELVEMHRMYRNRDFELVTISCDSTENRERVLNFLKDQEASFTNYLYDGDNPYHLIEALDSEWRGGLPYTLLVNAEGEIIYRHSGRFDDLEIKREIVTVLGRTYH